MQTDMVEKEHSGDNPHFPIHGLSQRHPQLKEKAIFDYVNGLEILDDQLRLRKQVNNSFFQRTWSSITGQAAQRQQLIDLNVTVSLNSFSICLQDLQLSQAESDLTIAHLADKLSETREGVMLLQGRQKSLLDQVDEFQRRVNNQFTKLESHFLHIDARTSARDQLEQVFDKWKAGRLDEYPPLARLFLVIDELHWGHFGTFCRISPKKEEVNRLWDQLADKVSVQMKLDLNIDLKKIMLLQDWLFPIQSLPEDLSEMLGYLSDWAQPETAPVTWAIQYAASPKKYFHQQTNHLPHVLSGQQVINYLIHENKNR